MLIIADNSINNYYNAQQNHATSNKYKMFVYNKYYVRFMKNLNFTFKWIWIPANF